MILKDSGPGIPTLTKPCRPAILQPLTISDLLDLVPVWDYLI